MPLTSRTGYSGGRRTVPTSAPPPPPPQGNRPPPIAGEALCPPARIYAFNHPLMFAGVEDRAPLLVRKHRRDSMLPDFRRLSGLRCVPALQRHISGPAWETWF